MATIFQKIFLPKYKAHIFDAIKQNADKIEYDYKIANDQVFHTLKIFANTLYMWAVLNKSTQTKKSTSYYHFSQYTHDGKITESHQDASTKFCDKVYAKMLNAFIAKNGHTAILNKQTEYIIASKNKQH